MMMTNPIAKMNIGALAIAWFLLIPGTTSAENKFPACRAAQEKVAYGEGLTIPAATRAKIDLYRAGWNEICDSGSRRKPSLSDLFVKAREIEADFSKILDAFDESILNESKVDVHRFTVVNDLLSKQYPAFVPAFQGVYGEEEYFSPSVAAFRQSSSLGNSEDRLFFDSHIPMAKDFPPFIRKTWDHGGCVLFGEFDWTNAMKNISRIEKGIKSSTYLSETAQYKEKLFRELTSSTNVICTCNAKTDVMKDFVSVRKYVRSEPRFASYTAKIQQAMDSIDSGKTEVKSEMEKHCSGG